jgi:hypothetical protein
VSDAHRCCRGSSATQSSYEGRTIDRHIGADADSIHAAINSNAADIAIRVPVISGSECRSAFIFSPNS